MKKYELTTDTKSIFGKRYFRIRALVDFGNVSKGDLGGYIESEDNLSNDTGYGNAWVGGEAYVGGDARVCNNAYVDDMAHVDGEAYVEGWSYVGGNARVDGEAHIGDNAWVGGEAYVGGDARVVGEARVDGEAYVDSNDCYTTIKGFGTEFRNTTFFRCKDNKIRVQCGCFYGDLEEFRQQVKDTRGGKIAKEYLMVADLMEYHFSEEK
jgi:hypothetical protein|nr:MAG TPA: nucleoside-diphosphate-sugar pyrophosphorylase [Caudoviricetes sp.]